MYFAAGWETAHVIFDKLLNLSHGVGKEQLASGSAVHAVSGWTIGRARPMEMDRVHIWQNGREKTCPAEYFRM